MKAPSVLHRKLAAVLALTACWSVSTYAVIVNFDDLDYGVLLTGSGYAGLTWETGNEGEMYHLGTWIVARSDSSFPYSPPHHAMNFHGATLMGIGFPNPVDVLGAYFSMGGIGIPSDVWADGVRVHGYLGGTEVALTDWFMDIDEHPDWFGMNLQNVDRIVIEADPGFDPPNYSPAGYYGMDDLTYVPEPSSILLCAFGALALLTKRRRG